MPEIMASQAPDIHTATVLAGIFLTNIGAIVTAFLTLKVSNAKLEVKVDRLVTDVNALWERQRDSEKKGK